MTAENLKSYAQTTVTPAKSRENVQALLERIGARGFRWSAGVGYPNQEVLEAFLEWNERPIAFRLTARFEDARQHRQMMRALFWYLKTKVEAIQLGLVDMEQEFLPYLLTEGGETVFEKLGGVNMRLLAAPNEEVSDENDA